LGDEKVRQSSIRQKRAFGSDSDDDDSNGMEESFSDSDDLCMKQILEVCEERKKSFWYLLPEEKSKLSRKEFRR
jgi:hypothetical protein